MPIHTGQCHCGAVSFVFQTEKPLAPRACQCGFCRKHGARTVTDPTGRARLTTAGSTLRYRFGSGAADFLVCGRCGIYVGAVAQIGGAAFATLNLNAFDEPCLELDAEPVSYQGETDQAKSERRRRRWTPAALAAD